MRGCRVFVTAMGAMITLVACSGGSGATFTDPPLPTLTSTTTPPSYSVSPRPHHDATAHATASAPAARTSSPAAPATSRPATHTASPTQASPTHHPTPSCAGVSASTTTIEEQAPDRFVPSTVAISRCDSVKAVYSDTTGVSHSFTGPGWDSGAMSASGTTSYSYRFASTGTFHFYCSYHKAAGMTGTITVT